ncbi:DNA repair protein RadC [Paenibacillus sp. PAMC21692]|uniref:RadC family protein n=1 Tax=Paenibacillus sp. PAMC21692 TaxID=2762320 RepID=UPI00164D925C|nr:DNA repair protein RadC [Paenibacillus sp. PAMC21692]QNK57443.1 DNA repair protein RadC [Paenibacillus sp. PAMC21692]
MNSYGLSSIRTLFADALAEKAESYIISEIFTRFPTVIDLMNVTEQELVAIKGIGRVRARQIISTLQLAQKLNVPVVDQQYIIRSPRDAAELLIPQLRYLQQEHFLVVFLNTKNHVIDQPETISIGTLNAAIVHPREVFRIAVKRSAASIVVCHNHPSGDPMPSPEDIQLTSRLVEAGVIMGVEVLDHLIIGGDRFLSLKEQGHM